MRGCAVNDVQGSGSCSGGIPIPNPDAIQEFKVQTGLYDTGYGRYPGANVSVITKSGGNDLTERFLSSSVLLEADRCGSGKIRLRSGRSISNAQLNLILPTR